jgi:hypothetical protein
MTEASHAYQWKTVLFWARISPQKIHHLIETCNENTSVALSETQNREELSLEKLHNWTLWPFMYMPKNHISVLYVILAHILMIMGLFVLDPVY